MADPQNRQSTRISKLDELLGGGLLPGTLTVVLGATGIGKTQLGLQYAAAGAQQEGERGILFDMTARGDSQGHRQYAERLCGWELSEHAAGRPTAPAEVWERDRARRDVCRLFDRAGRRVTAAELSGEDFRLWKAELNHRLHETISFFYGNFVHGVRRCVIDGIEPADRPTDSFQLELFEYIYHQILRKEHDWVARDLFRAGYREQEPRVRAHAYDHRDVGCLMLCTTHEVMLEALLSRPLQSGDVLSNANTILLMGKIREGSRLSRALCVAKHRGSPCDESIAPFEIGADGLRLL